MSEQAEYDAARQGFLEKLGLKVLRFDNAQVYRELDAVIKALQSRCMG